VEDVDAFFNAREKVESKIEVSFSGLLNAMDGVAAQEGRILILTTNHREKLDAALIRPGRIDKQLELANATAEQAKALFLRFFPEAQSLAEDIRLKYADQRHSPASIQQTLMGLQTAQQAYDALLIKLKG
jgi:mitochondrial chaperone BCS1